MQQVIDLNANWKIKFDQDDSLEKKGIVYDPDFLAEDWEEIKVPSHWQKEGYNYQGIVWYYNNFILESELRIANEERVFLKFNGIDYLAQVWFNGVYLGLHEGDFDSFQFEIRDLLKDNNKILVKVESEVDTRPEFKRVLKGAIYHWDCLPIKQRGLPDCPDVPSAANPRYPNPVINPGGIWQAVKLEVSSPYQFEEVLITPYFINNQEKVYLDIQGQVFNWLDEYLNIEGEILLISDNFSGKEFKKTFSFQLKPGQNYLNQSMELDNPELWWTWDLGKPNLYRLFISFNKADRKILKYQDIVGIREVKRGDNWELYLNGKRFFARGTNYLSDQFLSQSTEERYDLDLKLMLEANMNLIRVFSHMEKEYFYHQCDRLGILIWQDLPFQWGYEPDPYLIERARNISAKFVKILYNHPSIFLWCCHSESRFHDYNKLDRVLENELKKIDPSRPVWRNSVLMTRGDVPESFKDLGSFEDYNNNHLSVHWVGWYWGEIDDAEYYNPLFVTEFGSQSIPELESLKRFINVEDLWPPRWEEWRFRGFQTDIYQKNLGAYPDTLEGLIQVTQDYQHRFYKEHIEALRRKKYSNVNGLLQFHFVNTWPAIDWSIIDYYRKPKKAYYTIKKAFNPILLSFTASFEEKAIKIYAWIVNDLQDKFNNTYLEWKVQNDGKVIFEDRVKIQEIRPDSVHIYLEKTLKIDSKEVEVEGRLLQGGKELSSNQNLLHPLKDFSNLESVTSSS